MNNFLEKIIEYKNKLNVKKKSLYDTIMGSLNNAHRASYQIFKKNISKPGRLNLIAEIKKASPSKGMIKEDLDLLGIVKAYEDSGADAISILTEDKYFLGKPEYVRRVSDSVKVPILAKDFFLDEGQIYEAAYNGASAILLIVRILTDKQIKGFIGLAGELGMDCLVEIHSEEDLTRAVGSGAEIIGINNRNLSDFSVDMNLCDRLIPMVPKGKVIVAESGIKKREDVDLIKKIGANAVLIGEVLMESEDVKAKIKELF